MSVVGWEGETSLHVPVLPHCTLQECYLCHSLCELCPLEALGAHSTGLGRMISGLGLALLFALRGPRGEVDEKD